MIVPYGHLIALAALLFLMGLLCAVMRRNLIMMVLGLEIMLNAAALAFIGASLRWRQMEGQAIALFILAVAAAEVSVGLALIVAVYRKTGSLYTGTLEPDKVESSNG